MKISDSKYFKNEVLLENFTLKNAYIDDTIFFFFQIRKCLKAFSIREGRTRSELILNGP